MPIRSHYCVALDAHKKPLLCGLGVAVGCKSKSGQKKRLMCGAGWLLAAGCVAVGCRVKFGLLQTWMPIRSHYCAALDAHKKPLLCGLGVAVGCKSRHKKRLICGAGWRLAAG